MKKISFIVILCSLLFSQVTGVFGASQIKDSDKSLVSNSSYSKLPEYKIGFEGTGLFTSMHKDGSISDLSLNFFLMDPAGKVMVPSSQVFSQTEGYLPIPVCRREYKDAVMEYFGFVSPSNKDLVFLKVLIHNKSSKSISLTLAGSSKLQDNTYHYDKSYQILATSKTIKLLLPSKPQYTGPIQKLDYSAGNVRTNYLDLKYSFQLKAGGNISYVFKMPLKVQNPASGYVKALKQVDSNSAYLEAVTYWKKRLDSVKISLPDTRYSDAFKSSLATILLSRNGNRLMTYPGSSHFAYRDATYMAYALDMCGMMGTSTQALNDFIKMQQPNGYFPPEIDSQGKPINRKGWDAMGQTLWILGRHYRYTQDKVWLSKVFPSMQKGADFLIQVKNKANETGTSRTPIDGLLPAGYSGSLLGDGDWHRYWDNCWAAGGFYELMWSANALGKSDLYQKYGAEGNKLTTNISTSYLRLRVKYNQMWIPNAVEDIYTPDALLSATPGMWPCRTFNFLDPMVNMSFIQDYWNKWIQPNNGGFVNNGKYQPTPALALAHSYLYFDHPERTLPIAEYVTSHTAIPGFYFWNQSTDMITTKTNEPGPSGWAAAEYINLLRDMLVREEREGLSVLSAVPASWLDDGKTITFSDFPTYWGKFGLTLTSHAKENYAILKLTGSANPPSGYRIYWPLTNRPIKGMIVDGKIFTNFSGQFMILPSDAKVARIEF